MSKLTVPARVKLTQHTCPVCGRVQALTGKDRNYRELVSCGEPRCTSVLLARAAEAKLRNHDRPPEWEEARRAAHSASPLSGKHPDNASAEDWHLTAPDGTEWHFRNLSHFLREHPALFDPSDLMPPLPRAVSGISKLRPTHSAPRRSWKGWTWSPEAEIPTHEIP